MKLKIGINKSAELTVSETDGKIFINDEIRNFNLKKISEDHYLIYRDFNVYELRVLFRGAHHLSVNVNGETLTLDVKDHITQILEKLGMDVEQSQTVRGINAPMPGGILEVAVKPEDEVKKGDKLIILEAMKMENVIKSPVDGIVSSVYVKSGDNVEKNQLLVSF